METDNLHYSINALDGYKKDINFIISPRSDGKTTQVLKKVWKGFKELGAPSIIVVRNNVDITDVYVSSCLAVIEKVVGSGIDAKHAAIPDKGIASLDVTSGGKMFLRFLSLSQKLRNLKGAVLPNLYLIVFDEFIIDTRLGEKYLPQEAFKFMEMYTTYKRELARDHLKCYFMGNPYSLYNPHLVNLGVDCAALRKPCILTGPGWACERHFLNPDLKKKLMDSNPFFKDEDSEYAQYALEGAPINDANIRIQKEKPDDFSLSVVLKIEGKYIGVFSANDFDNPLRFWMGFIDEVGSRRCAYCFDFKDLADRNILVGGDERMKLARVRCAIRNRQAAFESLECDYLIEEIYNNL